MRELLVIGMGPGHPDQITVQAVQALNRVDVFFRIDKGDAKSGLNAARDEILRRHVTRPDYRVVEIPEPPRFAGKRFASIEAALADGPKFFADLMAAIGSDDGREIVLALEELRARGRLGRESAEGRYSLKQ